MRGTHNILVFLFKGVRIDFEKELETIYASDITPTVNKPEKSYAIIEGALAIINFDKFHSMMVHPHMQFLKKQLRQIKYN
jgi:hypothetical protein